jgi:hypothetical protein
LSKNPTCRKSITINLPIILAITLIGEITIQVGIMAKNRISNSNKRTQHVRIIEDIHTEEADHQGRAEAKIRADTIEI